MKNDELKLLSMANWYPRLSEHTFLTSFVPVSPEGVAALAAGITGESGNDSPAVQEMIQRLKRPLKAIPGMAFVGVDCCSPTDTARFRDKRGAVYSARSAWKFLAESAKVRAAAAAGEVSHICLRPFRRITLPREFRLFVRDRQLVGMSQYHLTRHFYRLDSKKDYYLERSVALIEEIAARLPVETLAVDVYFTASGRILILDLNPWGCPTDPLLARDWDHEWGETPRILLMQPPVKLSGDVNVSF